MAESSTGREPGVDLAPEDWFSADVATFGDRLAGAREAAGLSQEDLAQRLGVRLTTLQAWEDDMAEPRGNRLSTLAGMLNVSLAWLLTAEGDGLGLPEAEAMPAALSDALADLTRLRAKAAGLVQEIATVEKRLRQALRQE
ncbi:helix-turn-helix domain-containing protein [Pseudomonas sp. GX19020]|uniref:helix-turn-helix domain-containing protein n=1 Tax=Pseudomonadota TaxID=1224 RepID=UPI0008975ADC|nr:MULTISPECIES: helix-turn-helix transcriptional regulator [Pseudomonadota]MCL4066865.1 helix-turn-helix domain-containing protein [Pseudomonas sp. GX19020]SEB55084.1 transcriptional regulator, XRE family [Rhodobacter sp. 24-YEA-8]